MYTNMISIPQEFQPYLWSAPIAKLDIKKHERYIIHQLLQYCDLSAFSWLKKIYGMDELREVFLQHPTMMYTKQSLAFVTKYVLEIDNIKIQKERYVKSFR